MQKYRQTPLIPSAAIQARIRDLAHEIDAEYSGDDSFAVVGLMNGSLFFMADLLQAMKTQPPFECWRVTSYHGTATTTSGTVQGVSSCHGTFEGKRVLVVDDVLDSGLTLHAVKNELLKRGAKQVKICVLLRKKIRRQVQVKAHWIGFDIGKEFVVGYGLDYDGHFRQYRDIFALHPGDDGVPTLESSTTNSQNKKLKTSDTRRGNTGNKRKKLC